MSIVREYSAQKAQSGNTMEVDLWLPIMYTIVAKKKENEGLFTFEMEPSTDKSIAPLKPGQFNMLYVFGIGEIPISVSSLIVKHPRIVHTIQDVGAVSKAICELNIGDQIGVRGPFGSSWENDPAQGKDIIIMAGGVGFAPLRPLIEAIVKDRGSYGNVNVLYGTRSPDNIIFHQDVISLHSNTSVNFLVTVDHSFSNWYGNVGVVTSLMDMAKFDPEKTIAYVCGPEIMMRFGIKSLISNGIAESNIYLSMERNMKCAIGHCGHCQYGPLFVCKDGPVFRYTDLKSYLNIREL